MPEIERQFTFLRFFAYFLVGVGVLVILAGAGLAIMVATLPSIVGYDFATENLVTGPPNLAAAFGFLVGGLVTGVMIVVASQLIQVQLAREESARETNVLLEELFRRRKR